MRLSPGLVQSPWRVSAKCSNARLGRELSQEQYGRKDDRRHQRLHVHDASLMSNPAALGRIGNWLGTLVHVAQTARREFDSRLAPSLKEPQPGDPERQKGDEPPAPWSLETKEDATE
jgi:hypothetical protein